MVARGDRVAFVSSSDEWTKLEPGTLGTVSFIDDAGTVHVKWDDGSQLGMIEGEDRFRIMERPSQ